MPHLRKRNRNEKENEAEFMPLSKRINNLRINTAMLMPEQQIIATYANAPTNTASWPHGQQFPVLANGGTPDSPLSVEGETQHTYKPVLNESENPYYYTTNKLLYELYVARMHRANNYP